MIKSSALVLLVSAQLLTNRTCFHFQLHLHQNIWRAAETSFKLVRRILDHIPIKKKTVMKIIIHRRMCLKGSPIVCLAA